MGDVGCPSHVVSRRQPRGMDGLVIVAQNMTGSLFNSHIFDFVQGWTYVIGLGVAGGMVLAQKD